MNKKSTPVREGFAVARDGSPIYYRSFGAPVTPALVLSDGIGCDGYVWKYIEEQFAPERRVIRWHYRGHGQTPRPANPRHVTIPDLADDLEAVLDALGEPPAVIAGHSMGVQVALEFYRRHRDRNAALMLLCGSYGTPLRTFKGRATLETALPFVRLAVMAAPRLAGNLWRTLLPTRAAYEVATLVEINRELVKRDDFFPYLEHIARVDVELFLEMLAAAGRHSAREMLDAVEVPTLVVAGDHDGFTPLELSLEMARRIPGADLLVVEGGSHTAPIERPELVCARIRQFLGEHDLGGKHEAPRQAAAR